MSNCEEHRGSIIDTEDKTYILIDELGNGSYATVWSCYNVEMKTLYAIKIFKYSESKAGNIEIEYYKKLKNINIVSMHNSFEYDNKVCIVLDLTLGSLYDVMQNGICNEDIFTNGFNIDFIIKITYNILLTLKDLHSQNILHGDIKPENILLYGITENQKQMEHKLKNTSNNKHYEYIQYIQDTDNSIINTDTADNLENSDNSGSDMSMAPRKMKFTSSDTKSEQSQHTIIIPEIYMQEPIVKLSDFGACVDITNSKKPFGVQTKYYKSPEIILHTGYGIQCDIWALGCTLYEFITGSILFDPDEYNIDSKRGILHLIYAIIEPIPNEMINSSPIKQIFYTNDCLLKGKIEHKTSIWTKLVEHIKSDTIKKYLLIDLLLEMLMVDPNKRITASDAINHPLFT